MKRALPVGVWSAVVVAPSRWYNKTYSANPITTAGATMGIKAAGCDIVAQKWAHPDRELDLTRILKFSAFCVGYVGSFQHHLYNRLYPKLFKGSGFYVALRKSLFDAFVHTPLLYLPSYYAYKALVNGESVGSAVTDYWGNGFSVFGACTAIFVPAQLINFWVVPPNFRIMFIAWVGCAWEVILSYMAPLEVENAAHGNTETVLEHGDPRSHVIPTHDEAQDSPTMPSFSVEK